LQWEVQETFGATPPVVVLPAGSRFTYKETAYFGLFGGHTQDSMSDELYLY